MIPEPDRATVGNVARLLATMSPTAAGDATLLIMAAIADGLAARGWRQDQAERFACDFGRAVAQDIATMARPAGTRLH